MDKLFQQMVEGKRETGVRHRLGSTAHVYFAVAGVARGTVIALGLFSNLAR